LTLTESQLDLAVEREDRLAGPLVAVQRQCRLLAAGEDGRLEQSPVSSFAPRRKGPRLAGSRLFDARTGGILGRIY
jgi:hypothetical protein